MGWEGIHLYQFCPRSRRYGSWEVSASSPDVTLAALQLRRGAGFTYEYGLNIPWRHEVKIEENRLAAEPGKALPRCTAGDSACPPEDCGGLRSYPAGLDDASSWDRLEDLHTMADFLREVMLENRPEEHGAGAAPYWRLANSGHRLMAIRLRSSRGWIVISRSAGLTSSTLSCTSSDARAAVSSKVCSISPLLPSWA